jgi:hypothetical protein
MHRLLRPRRSAIALSLALVLVASTGACTRWSPELTATSAADDGSMTAEPTPTPTDDLAAVLNTQLETIQDSGPAQDWSTERTSERGESQKGLTVA